MVFVIAKRYLETKAKPSIEAIITIDYLLSGFFYLMMLLRAVSAYVDSIR